MTKYSRDPLSDKVSRLLDDELTRLIRQLRPRHVLYYLNATGWQAADSPFEALSRWVRRDDVGDLVASVDVPLLMDPADYNKLMVRAVRLIAVVDDWPVHMSLDAPAMLRDVSEAVDAGE